MEYWVTFPNNLNTCKNMLDFIISRKLRVLASFPKNIFIQMENNVKPYHIRNTKILSFDWNMAIKNPSKTEIKGIIIRFAVG